MDFELLTVDFAYKTWDTARDLWARNATSILGTAQAMGGISQIAGGIATCMGLVTCVAGFAVALHGLDDLVTGLDTAASGEFNQSYTNYGLLQSAQVAGFSEDTAKRIADTGEIGVGLLTGGLGDAARTVGKQAAKSSAMAVAKNVLQHTGTRLAVEGGITVGVGLGVGVATNSFENGLFAAQFGQIAGGIAADFSVACFTAGTPIVVDLEGNSRNIEELEVGDTVLARSEFDPAGPLELKRIEEKFVRTAAVMELVIRGRSIKSTAEHPFYVPAQGKFIAAGELEAGDELVSHTGELVRIETVSPLGEVTTVYNLRVADHHTYFVGGGLWQFDVWVHNSYNGPEEWRSEFDALRELSKNGRTLKDRYLQHLIDQGLSAKSPAQFEKVSVRNWENAENGSLFQNQVRDALGAPRGPGSGHYPIGEFRVDLPPGVRYGVTDIKNMLRVSRTDQINAFIDYAVDNDLPFNLIVSQRTHTIDGPIIRDVRTTGGTIFEFNGATGGWSTLDLPRRGPWHR